MTSMRSAVYRTFRVHFIGAGYESVAWVTVAAPTPGEAMDKAMQQYEDSGWKFKYQDLEAQEIGGRYEF